MWSFTTLSFSFPMTSKSHWYSSLISVSKVGELMAWLTILSRPSLRAVSKPRRLPQLPLTTWTIVCSLEWLLDRSVASKVPINDKGLSLPYENIRCWLGLIYLCDMLLILCNVCSLMRLTEDPESVITWTLVSSIVTSQLGEILLSPGFSIVKT